MCTNSIERVQTYLEDFKNELSNTKGVPVELILKPISSWSNVHNAISIKETMLDECKKIQEIYDKIIRSVKYSLINITIYKINYLKIFNKK